DVLGLEKWSPEAEKLFGVFKEPNHVALQWRINLGETMNQLELGQKLDQYELFDVFSRCDGVIIFRAWDKENSRLVALKVPQVLDERKSVLQRLLHEKEIGSHLDHPAIMKVRGPKENGRAYLVMEYVEGELLSDRLRREGRLSTAAAVDYAVQIANALVYLHEHNIIHRDLKSDNIMILPGDRVKLIDFSIALDGRPSNPNRTAPSRVMGTADYYMAPEQVKGRRGDAR